jgi:hypothetical protein
MCLSSGWCSHLPYEQSPPGSTEHPEFLWGSEFTAGEIADRFEVTFGTVSSTLAYRGRPVHLDAFASSRGGFDPGGCWRVIDGAAEPR